MMRFHSIAIILVIFSLVLVASNVSVASVDYSVYEIDNVKVIIVDSWNPTYSFDYCGVNRVDLDLSNDYATKGPGSILNILENVSAQNISLTEIKESLRHADNYTVWFYTKIYNTTIPEVVIHPDYGAIEVILKPGVDPQKVSRDLVYMLKDLMSSKGYSTLILVKGQSDLTPDQIGEIADKIAPVVFNPSDDAPTYLQRLYKLRQESLNNSVGKTYIRVGVGLYGETSIVLWGPEPSIQDLVDIAKYIRDKTGICNGTLYIKYAGPNPPTGMLLPKIIEQSQSQDTPANNHPIQEHTSFSMLLMLSMLVMASGIVMIKRFS